MFRELVLREILDNLKSLRFMLSFLIILSVFILSGILFIGKYKLAVADWQENKKQNLKTLEQSAKELNLVAMATQRLLGPPPVLGFVCTGFEENLPNVLYINAFSVVTMGNLTRSNFLFPRFSALDWGFIIGIFLSFVALALTFDGISREKEDGTLRLVMTNAFPRYQFVLAKYAGTLFVLMIPVIVSILVNLIIVTVSNYVILTAAHWMQIFLIIVASLIYLSVYILLGLLISALTHRSTTSLVLCLILWAVTVLLIPNTGGLLAQAFYPLPKHSTLQKQIELARNEIWNRYPNEAQSFIDIDRYRPAHRLRAAANNEALDVEIKLREDYFNKQVQQVMWGRKWTSISSAAVYQYTLEKLADVGFSRFLNFRGQVQNYRTQLIDFVKKKDALDPESPHWINPFDGILFSTKPIDYTQIPKFDYKLPNIEKLLRESLMDIFLLISVNLILFALSIISFRRFDVR